MVTGPEGAMVCLLIFAFVAHAGERAPVDRPEAPAADVLAYPIGSGDILRVEVVGEEAMSGAFRVGGDGAIDLPYAGRIPVAGLTVDEAARAVTGWLGKSVLARPQVVLGVETYASRLVDVGGIVAKPASYALERGRTTVSDVIVRAGGLNEPSAPRALIFRDVSGERTVIEVDLERLNVGDLSADVELRAGDHLYVPPVESVYVDGQAGKPGAISYRDGMTVTQAIAQAGGTSSTARRSAVYIVRGNERIPVNLKKIQNGEEADIVLRPSDRIFIPESAF
jgi:polysaccharide export outer membrane protein